MSIEFQDDPDLDSASFPAFVHTPSSLDYVVTHVFLPVELPSRNDYSPENELSLARAVCAAAHAYITHVSCTAEPQWHCVTKMLDDLQASVQSDRLDNEYIISQLRGMGAGDVLVFFIRPQSAALILTKRESCVVYEAFEVSPKRDAVETTGGSLICSYPASAVETPNQVFSDKNFQFELANFLSRPSRPNANSSDLPSPPPAHPQYITALLTGILRGVGRIADVPRITKRVRDHVGRPPKSGSIPEPTNVWRRSSLWLLIRVAIQTSIDRSPIGRALYKEFILFFICTLARDRNNARLSSDLLHLMSSKILRRLSKLGSYIPSWLSEMALKTCGCLRNVLDARWKRLNGRRSTFRNPSQDELARDTQISLLGSREYIHSALEDSDQKGVSTPFFPSHPRRGTIDDFLSSNGSFFEDAYQADPDVTLYDVEQSVEHGIDDWVTCVTDVDEACTQLEILMDKYMMKAGGHRNNPEDVSIMLLTVIELFVALDKLAVMEIPMLIDYLPEIPTTLLEGLFLRKTTSLHRLSRVYHYLAARQSGARPGWMVLSSEFTEDSFPVRYYDQSSHLQQLKARIEADAMPRVPGRAKFPHGAPYDDRKDDSHPSQSHVLGKQVAGGSIVLQSSLPTSLLHAKVVVFELQCPPCIRIWRSAAPRILHRFYLCSWYNFSGNDRTLLPYIPELQPYFVQHQAVPISVRIQLAYFYPGNLPSRSPALHYVVQCPISGQTRVPRDRLSRWWPERCYKNRDLLSHLRYMRVTHSSSESQIEPLTKCTSHTSNGILSAQADCPLDFSLDEFIAFGHLRSGGSLQWLNILRGLRSRTLNFRRHEVHYLLSHAIFQVGPLDLNTGVWTWHQELQDPSFCNAILEELESLFVEVGTGSIDGVMMNTISLLLTRVLASSPGEGVSERAIALLRKVRKKTFNWVQELSYNLTKAPTNKERSDLLRDMAATCRSTFDVDPATLHKHFHSAEDVDALLHCALLIHALRPKPSKDDHAKYSELLLERDHRLSLALERTLRDVILTDPSGYGIDLAVGKIFASYKPGTCRWEQLQYPNARWLTCKSDAKLDDQPLQTVQLNMLDGMLRVDGQPLGGLPHAIRQSPECQQIFRDQGFFVIPSTLPGMDFTTLAMTSKYQVHFSVRDDNLVLRAQRSETAHILELIPSMKLREDLPTALVKGHVHWLNLVTKTIEIRSLEQPWEESSENWRIDCTFGQYRIYKGHETLVDVLSPTWAMVSKCFECLNDIDGMPSGSQSMDLMIIASPINILQPVSVLRLSVALSRYGLSFFVNERGELQSRDFQDLVYDENQCIGALFGLESLLVLRQKSHLAEELIPRRVIIPNGLPERHGDQVRVDISLFPPVDEPLYHTYNVDTELGCLTGVGGMESMRYLAHLHATTSCDRPDPLTGKTGAQAALRLLQSSGCRSITKLNTIDIWSSTRYPQISAAQEEIQSRYYSHRGGHGYRDDSASQKRIAKRAAYLFPSDSTGPTSPEDCGDMDYAIPEADLELEIIASVAASATYRWSNNTPTINIISHWAELWSKNDTHLGTASSLSACKGIGPRLNTNLAEILMIRVHEILERRQGTRHHYQLLFLLPTMAYCSPHNQVAFLSMLIAFAEQVQSNLHDPSIHAGHELSDGYRPTENVLRRQVCRFRLKEVRLNLILERQSVDAAVKHLLKSWPSLTPPSVIPLGSQSWDVAGLTAGLQPLFSSCYRNFNLKEQLMRLLAGPEPLTLSHPLVSSESLRYMRNERPPIKITLDQLLSDRPPPELPSRNTLQRDRYKGNKASPDGIPTLARLLSALRTSSSFQREYVTQLNASAQHFYEELRKAHKVTWKYMIETLEEHYVRCRVNYFDALAALRRTLGPTTDPFEKVLDQIGQWPPITADVLLRYLASTSRINLPEPWKKCFISLALLLLELQRARRLLRFALDGLEEEFSKELENEGCDGWNPEEYPDWLLIQVQGNFLIRRAQAESAMEMILPQSGGNTVMQVNMGEGKSSVIIPIAAAALADGKQLVRVIVPKALTVQMFELLAARLGGLTNRPIYYLPFSRAPEDDNAGKVVTPKIDDLHRLMSQCMAECGILIARPEHIVSLRLRGVEEQIGNSKPADNPLPKLRTLIHKYISVALSLKSLPEVSLVGNLFRRLSQSFSKSSKKVATLAGHPDDYSGDGTLEDSASKWLQLQKWTHSHARDILDESDEILHARFQLIYTIGFRQHMDGYPDRWLITQQVLRLVKERAHTLSINYPDSLEYEYASPPGSFPHVRIVQGSDVGRYLISLIVEDVMAGQLSGLNFRHVSAGLRDAIRSFISDENVLQVPETAKMVEEYAKGSHHSHLWSGLLLLRGLLASNILLFALTERRWRVDYGLLPQSRSSKYSDPSPDPVATLLAVPYRAKDVPAPNTQFGHPDITIMLTCLSYYYVGLSEEQLRVSFEMLLDQDDPSKEYALWVKDYSDCESLPDSLQKLDEINPRSSEQWDKVIFPLFTRNQAAINFYLSRVVFPKEAKEFPWKLSGSSWDLAEKREKLITGFSGTNDSRWLLPMSIAQCDLDHQQGTNARVLAYLLQPQNDSYMVTHGSGERQTTLKFLHMVTEQQPEIRVLLDVGAQILDFSNRQVAKAWLDITCDTAGAIYFNEHDELMVLTRNGIVQSMISSPLSQQLDRCVVYLDHAHTRGTDIKLPIGSRAAVTLGPKVTKDRLVQGCMRMRKLGHGHSVMFFAPLEVDRNIRGVAGKNDPNAQVTTIDILCWAIHETWTDIQQRAPYWAQQGMSHKSRYEAWTSFCNGNIPAEQLSDAWLQRELGSLDDLYAPCEAKNPSTTLATLDPEIRQRCKDLGVLSFANPRMEEEQEREVNREIEREREVELPPKAKLAEHFLHQDVVALVRTGIIPPLHSTSAFRPVFTTLEKSSAATRDADVWSPSILATADFCRTIEPDTTRGTMDQYLRPVQWILSRKKDRDHVLILLSPFEADCLMPDIRASRYVHLHLYAPRTSQQMKPSDDLMLYSTPSLPSDWAPPWGLIDQLNVFSGQLYLRDYKSYLRLCRFLDVPTNESPGDTAIRRNMFNIPGSFEENEITFSGSPLPSVTALLAIRSRGRPFSRTHIGKILQGQLLTEKDF